MISSPATVCARVLRFSNTAGEIMHPSLLLKSVILCFVAVAIINLLVQARNLNKRLENDDGQLWAVLVAGSNYYSNYRHQADVCHAYHLLKKGGLRDENIIVMMYDDIANSSYNRHPGQIFNRPGGPDVYEGVLKDYTGSNVNKNNFFAVLSGNKSALVKGKDGEHSGKVLATGPNDHVFIYYTDHGGPGVVSMLDEIIYANEMIDVLRKKHEAKDYKSILFYLEACESGSIFQGLLPDNWDIYALTAANSTEGSWGTYCPADFKTEFDVCLGDLFSVAWMEDTENHSRLTETLSRQYEIVKERVKGDTLDEH